MGTRKYAPLKAAASLATTPSPKLSVSPFREILPTTDVARYAESCSQPRFISIGEHGIDGRARALDLVQPTFGRPAQQ